MDNKRKVSRAFNNNPQESRLRVQSKNRWWNCVQTVLIIAKLRIGKTGQKTADWEKSIMEAKIHIGM